MRLLTVRSAIACGLAVLLALLFTYGGQSSHAQVAGRGPIQAPAGGGRGSGVAPAADDPANVYADLSPKPPVVAAPPKEEARRFWLPPGYRMQPVLADPVIEDPAEIRFDGE